MSSYETTEITKFWPRSCTKIMQTFSWLLFLYWSNLLSRKIKKVQGKQGVLLYSVQQDSHLLSQLGFLSEKNVKHIMVAIRVYTVRVHYSLLVMWIEGFLNTYYPWCMFRFYVVGSLLSCLSESLFCSFQPKKYAN